MIPYLIYSTIPLFLGGVSYKFLKSNDEEVKKEDLESEYSLVKDDLTDTIINLDKRSLGRSLDEKIENMKIICKEECGIDNNIKNRSKLRQRLKRYIKAYEVMGHKEFVKNYKKK